MEKELCDVVYSLPGLDRISTEYRGPPLHGSETPTHATVGVGTV
jgi:hypothetical protein